MTFPNFLIIGAGRAGTTSLYHWFREHPEVYMSTHKEACWFVRNEIGNLNRGAARTREQYEAMFAGATDEKAIGEACPMYLSNPRAPERIFAEIPHARFIASLRDPAERAYSAWTQSVTRRGEHRDVYSALRSGSKYFGGGLYAAGLRRYFERFPRENSRVILFDDLVTRPDAIMRELFVFLGIDPDVRIKTAVRYNESRSPRSVLLNKLFNEALRIGRRFVPSRLRNRAHVRRMQEPLLRERQTMPADLRKELIAAYRDDILETQELIGRDLSHWLV